MTQPAPRESAHSSQLDVLKGMAILLVVAGHVLNRSPWPDPQLRLVAGWLVRLVYSFHIPLFFMLSGALFGGLRGGGPLRYIAGRYLRLMLPLGVYALLYHLMFHPGQGDVWSSLARLYVWGNHWALLSMPTQAVLWFFPALLCLNCLALTTGFFERLGPLWGLVALLTLQMACLWVFSQGIDRRYVPYCLDVALVSLFFFHAGRVAAERLKRPAPVQGRGLRLTAALSLLVLLAFVYASRPYESLDVLRLRLWEMPLMDLSAITGAAACVLLSGTLARHLPWLEECLGLFGRHSLPIFGMHMFVVSGVMNLKLLPTWWVRLVLTFVLAVLLPWSFARFIARHSRPTRWLFLGGRV
ncbi:MAG: acyltransferase [Deltaproteobacteria bacterium]|nr:acyltransferase [Deltaproteobacteria bacterium]